MKKDYNRILTDFVRKQREKSFAFLQKNYSLDINDSDAVFQDSLVVLWQKLQGVDDDGIKNMTSTSTFFLTICKNKVRELLRSKGKIANVIDDDVYDFSRTNAFKQENIDYLLTFDTEDDIIKREKDEILHNIVKDLPQPCDDLLWGFYGDDLSLKELAEKYNYKSEGTVKVTKHRCLQKLIARYKAYKTVGI